MRRALFDYVEQIRAADKYFDVSAEHIARELRASGKCEVKSIHELVDDNGEEVATELRLNFSGPSEYRHSWKVALKLHETRIDGVDYETSFDMKDGKRAKGWHRHHWNPAEDSAERHKLPLEDFNEVQTRQDFINRAMSVLRFRLNRLDHGETGSLFIE
jgi:hypothetical protein